MKISALPHYTYLPYVRLDIWQNKNKTGSKQNKNVRNLLALLALRREVTWSMDDSRCKQIIAEAFAAFANRIMCANTNGRRAPTRQTVETPGTRFSAICIT